MSTSKEIIDSLRKALAFVPEVSFLAMGDNYGVHSRGRLFAMVSGGNLFLKLSPETLCLFRDRTVYHFPGINTCKANPEWFAAPEKLAEAVLYTLTFYKEEANGGTQPPARGAGRPAGRSWTALLPWEKTLAFGAALLVLYFTLPYGTLRALGIRRAEKAADFSLSGLNGERVSLSGCRGKPVFLYLWETHSQRSLDNLPMLDALYAAYRGREVCFVPATVESDFDANVRALARAKEIKHPVYNGSGKIAARARAPMLYLIDHEGYVRKSYSPAPDQGARVAADLEALLREAASRAAP